MQNNYAFGGSLSGASVAVWAVSECAIDNTTYACDNTSTGHLCHLDTMRMGCKWQARVMCNYMGMSKGLGTHCVFKVVGGDAMHGALALQTETCMNSM